jgi:hypothetical protein
MRSIPFLMFMSMVSPAAFAQAPADPPAAQHARLSWEQHFARANATHDGHLTLEQAKAGYVTIARHFQDIDTAGKGYVTQDDIRAWHKMQRASRHPAKASSAGDLRPRQAMQRMVAGEHPFPPQRIVPMHDDSAPQNAAVPDAAGETH